MEIAHSVPPSYDTQTLMPTPTPQSVLGTDAPLKNTSDLFFSMWEKFGRELARAERPGRAVGSPVAQPGRRHS